MLSEGPVEPPADWASLVHEPFAEGALADIRPCAKLRAPLGQDDWRGAPVARLYRATLRPRRRPRRRYRRPLVPSYCLKTSPSRFGTTAVNLHFNLVGFIIKCTLKHWPSLRQHSRATC